MKIHSLKYNFIMNFILSVSSFVFPLVTFPYISRVLTADGVGAVSFAISFVSYFTLVASLGIPTYGVRACAEIRDDQEKLRTLVQELLIINTVTTLLTVLIYVFLIQVIPRLMEDKLLFYICGLNIVLNTLGANWFFQAIEQYDYITVRSLVFKVISLILLFAVVREANDYILYAAITVFAAVGSCILNFVKMIRLGLFKKTRRYCFKRHMKPIFFLFAQSAAVSIYTNLDTVMLGLMRSNQDVGYYYIATQIKQLFLMLITSFANVLLPRMTTFVAKKENSEFLRALSSGINFTLFISLPLAMFFLLAGSDAILLFAGPGYQESILPTKILMFALIAIGLSQVIGVQVLVSLKRENQLLISVIVGAGVNVALNFIFIPTFGALGTALSTFCAEIIVLSIQLFFTRTLLRQIRKTVNFPRYFVASVSAFVVAIVFYSLLLDFWLWLRVLFAGFAFLLIYFSILKLNNDAILNEAMGFASSILGALNKKRFK